MRAFLPNLIAQRRAEQQDDLLSRLVEADVDGERLTQEDILGFQFVCRGIETVHEGSRSLALTAGERTGE